jgi:hypothetical protein
VQKPAPPPTSSYLNPKPESSVSDDGSRDDGKAIGPCVSHSQKGRLSDQRNLRPAPATTPSKSDFMSELGHHPDMKRSPAWGGTGGRHGCSLQRAGNECSCDTWSPQDPVGRRRVHQPEPSERAQSPRLVYGQRIPQRVEGAICFGPDPGGGAEDVAALVRDNASLISKYDSILDMSSIAPDDLGRRAWRRS